MSSDGAIPGRHAGSGARPYILLGNASHHSASGVCDRVPSPPPSQDNAYFVKKTQNLLVTQPFLRVPEELELPSVLQPLILLLHCQGLLSCPHLELWQLQPSFYSCHCFRRPLFSSPHPARPSPRLAPSSCSLPSPIHSPHSCHVAGLPWALPTTGLPSFWSAEDGR